jgi:hypothetical protein
MPFRALAVTLAVVLLITFAAPAKAEAIEPMTALAIAGAAIVVIVLVVYLVIANVEEGRTAEQPAGTARFVGRDAGVVWVAVAIPRESP